jgi:hypothetical protein
VGCHNEKLKTAGLTLDKMDPANPGEHAEAWEKVVRKVRAGMMPPSGARRPDRAVLDAFASTIEAGLDRWAVNRPNPGATALHRLNRTEYANAVRDLLAIDVDAATLLPPDDSSEGFDNIADVLGVSPALLERYVSAATKISRVAVGDPAITAATTTYRVAAGLSQADHIEGLPLGTRGGILFRHTFPLDAEYTFRIRARGGGAFQGVGRDEQIEVTVNGTRVKLLPGGPSQDVKLAMKAGPQSIGVAFVKKGLPGADDLWTVISGSSGIASIAITGPLNVTGPGETPSRSRLFVCRPAAPTDELPCAKQILTALARRAYRRPPTDGDLETLLGFYQRGRNDGSFETGIQRALERVLIDARFVFRVEREPGGVTAGASYPISDLELASRLSFFLWSSIPDDELLDVAARGKLRDPAELEKQARRMLADPRARALVDNFAGQWLYLRELRNARPQARDFDDNLRQSFLRETEMLVDSVIRQDRSVLDLLTASDTFVDERLARHYGIPNIYGSQFRRVTLKDDARRGLLGKGSILLVTSVANRTSPVARGKWILENLLGTAAPLPPPNVPPLKENAPLTKPASVRERMEEHRANPVCAACHKIMDPIGLALENFDLTGKWRDKDGNAPIDASGELVDGTKLNGPASLREALLSRSDVFVTTMTEKLLTYGLGRGARYYDMPAVRAIVRDAAPNDYRFSSLALGIVKSLPFQYRTATATERPETPARAATARERSGANP